MKNSKTIAAAVLLLLVLLVGRLMWTKSVQEPDVAVNQPNVSQASVYPTPDVSKINPRAADMMAKASLYDTQRKYKEAIELYERALQIEDNPTARLLLSNTLARAGRRQEAMKMLKELVQAQPETWVGDSAKRSLARFEKNPNWGLPKQ